MAKQTKPKETKTDKPEKKEKPMIGSGKTVAGAPRKEAYVDEAQKNLEEARLLGFANGMKERGL